MFMKLQENKKELLLPTILMISETGAIGVTQKLTPEQLDIKLNSLLSKSSEKSFYGKYTPLSKS